MPVVTGVIDTRAITVTAATDTKPYNATTTSTGTPTVTVGSIVSPDTGNFTQVFDSPNAGSRTLTPSGSVSDGNSGNNYAVSFLTASGTITKANAVVSITPYSGVYNANPHSLTGTATGLGGSDLSASLNFGASFTNVPGGTATWTFTGGTNYNDQTGTGAVAITQAPSTTVVTFEGGPYTYRGTPFTAAALVTGVGGLSTSIGVLYTGDCTNVTVANGVTATATFAGDLNHSGSFDSKSITITQASTTTTVTPSPNPSIVGEALPLTADVSASPAGSAGNRTGLVTFFDGATAIGTATLSSNQAVFTTSILASGAHSLTAVYAGNRNFIDSTSSAMAQQVNTRPTTTVLSLSPDSVAVGVASPANVAVTDATGSPSGAGSFASGFPLAPGVVVGAATPLLDGRVLVTGGQLAGSGLAIATATLYDPLTGAATPAGSMNTPRFGHTATRLRDGRVLVVGGRSNTVLSLATAELYDPATNTFTAVAGTMTTGQFSRPRRFSLTAVCWSSAVTRQRRSR